MTAYVRRAYHRDVKTWRTDTNRPEGQRAGIELEIEHPHSFETVLEAIPRTNNPDYRPATEVDGSLNAAKGVEIIFPPFRYSQITNGNSFFRRTLKALEDAGCEPTTNCGMHVNINTTGWNVYQRAAFTVMNNALPATLLQRIGGRRLNGYCGQHYLVTAQSIGSLYTMVTGSHNTVASPRRNRIELRFPAATTDPKKVRLILDYAHYLELFAKSREWNVDNTIGVELGPENEELGRKALRVFTAFVKGQKRTAGRDRLLKVLRGN